MNLLEEKSEDNEQSLNEGETITIDGHVIDIQKLMQMFATHKKQSMLYISFTHNNQDFSK